MRRPLSAMLAAGLFLVASTADAKPRPDIRFAQADGRKVAYTVIGQAGPTVVFIAGLGDDLNASRAVARRLSANARVIVYDRAGYGDSDAAPASLDGRRIVAELDAVLDAAGGSGRVVVVGHSIGGQMAELYAAARPERVAGLVLDDSRPADFTARCLAALPRAQCVPPVPLTKLFPAPMRREYEASERLAAEVEATRPYAGPTLVLSRHPGNGAVERLWAKAQADLAGRHHALQATSPKGGHYVHNDAPAWFDAQVGRFMASLKS